METQKGNSESDEYYDSDDSIPFRELVQIDQMSNAFVATTDDNILSDPERLKLLQSEKRKEILMRLKSGKIKRNELKSIVEKLINELEEKDQIICDGKESLNLLSKKYMNRKKRNENFQEAYNSLKKEREEEINGAYKLENQEEPEELQQLLGEETLPESGDETDLQQERERIRRRHHRELADKQAQLEKMERELAEEKDSRLGALVYIQELRSELTAAQQSLDEYRRQEQRDWIIKRKEVTITQKNLGAGGWGSVVEGRFRGSKVAVKQIHDLILSPHNRRLFEREMSIASQCRHPCLLQFIGATNDDGEPLFVTELLDTDLRSVLKQRSLLHEEIITIACDIAVGLNYLHLNKPSPIIHRDISSSNVLLWKRNDCWRGKLSDYGAANFMRLEMTAMPGASIYAAPEAMTNQQSPKIDVYSFGLLLCEMCIGEIPVPQQTQEQIERVQDKVLRELVMKCVQTFPESRLSIAEVITYMDDHFTKHYKSRKKEHNISRKKDHCISKKKERSIFGRGGSKKNN